MAAKTLNEINEMLCKTGNLSNLGIVPVGHSAAKVWVFLEKDKLPAKKCPKHSNMDMEVDITNDDRLQCKEGTLFYRCNTPGCLENLYPLYSAHQLNQELATEKRPAILY